MPNSASPRSPGPAGQEPGRPSILSPTGGKNSLKDELHREISRENSANKDHANPPTGVENANLAVARGDVTSGLPPATSSNGAARALRNWADCPEDQGPGADDDFTVVRTKKRRRESANSPTAAAPSSNIGGARTSRRPQSSAGSVPRAQEVRTTRAHITEARARQTSSSEDHCVYLEHGPELQPFHYLRALDRMLGGTAGVIQVSKVNGHQLLGLANRGLAERLINEGLEVEGALLRAFPFRKRAERITVGNLPFFVEDSAIISALKPYGRVTSIAPKLMKAGPYTYNDGRREAFIVLREGMTIERLPTRLEIPIKGEAWPAYLSSGIKCSRCHGQGHRRANCPMLAGRANNSRLAPPTSPAGVPSTTTSAPPQRSAAQPPAPAPSSTAMEIPGASHAARAVTPSAAPRPSTPVASAVPMEMAPPAPPPVTPAPSLRAPGSHEPAAPTPDIEMSIVEETSTSSTSSLKTSTREGLVTFIERNPGISFAQTDALGLGREEVLDILSSKTKARKRGPLLSPSQCGALAGLIRQLLGQRPGGDSNIYKVLRQVLSELRTAPTAVPSTPPLPAPRPSGPTPPTSHSEELMPAVMTPPPPAPTEMEEDNPMTEKERCAPPPPAPRLAEPTPPTPHGEELTPAMATPPPPLPFLTQVELETKCVDRIFDLFKEQNYQQALGPLLKKGLDIDNLSHSIVWLKSREYLLKSLRSRPRHKASLAEFLGTVAEHAHDDHPLIQNLRDLRRYSLLLSHTIEWDEKWIHYDNPKRRKSSVKPGHASTSTAKPNIHGKKLMLCIWWDQLGVIYYELLQPNETITGERYQQQLMRLSRALKIKRPLYAKRHDKVIYQHDNARPHVAKVVKETLEALQWDVLPHPLYSPDIAPSDYHMFRSMTHGLAEQHFTSYEEAKNWVNIWIASKDEEFFRHGIRKPWTLNVRLPTQVILESPLSKKSVSEDDLKSCVPPLEEDLEKASWYHAGLSRLGHRNIESIKKIQNENLARGLSLNNCSHSTDCVQCIQGKLTETPFPKKTEYRATETLQLVRSDVCGPLPTNSISGKRYFITFTDDYSRYTKIYLLKGKDEVYEKIKDYVISAHTEFGKNIQTIRIDIGREYVNRQVEDFLNQSGIKHQLTVPYSPAQNGVAERKNRSLMEMTRCMLFD
ncbi:hypothetical protein LAZ67_1004196 [Cordylochernes scorpioides]|uniref:Integrase catalytic domain-containing protein n=1 Tax=Cordylochernes scorpioides TaxID=51811 RepID=A0ABY6K077_9ARAC|nr:hypothetical protein LAZ67_1004196 [Cordylochernes scorpioides]